MLIRTLCLLVHLTAVFAPCVAAGQELGPLTFAASVERELGADFTIALARAQVVRQALQRGGGVSDAALLASDLDRIDAGDLLLADRHRQIAQRLADAGVPPVMSGRTSPHHNSFAWIVGTARVFTARQSEPFVSIVSAEGKRLTPSTR